MPKDFETTGVLDHIAALSSAEDIFTYLLMPYDEDVLNISRLHILQRFGSYLKKADLAGLGEDETFLAARRVLKRAYGDFLASTPLKEKVFKVFRTEEEKRKARFVGLDSLQLAAE